MILAIAPSIPIAPSIKDRSLEGCGVLLVVVGTCDEENLGMTCLIGFLFWSVCPSWVHWFSRLIFKMFALCSVVAR